MNVLGISMVVIRMLFVTILMALTSAAVLLAIKAMEFLAQVSLDPMVNLKQVL